MLCAASPERDRNRWAMPGNGATRPRVLQLDPRDNALVALTDLRKGEIVEFGGERYELLSDIAGKHKFVTQDVPAGGGIYMYGVLVGKTSEPLRRGDLLSTRNLRHAAAPFHDQDLAVRWSPPDISRHVVEIQNGDACGHEARAGRK